MHIRRLSIGKTCFVIRGDPRRKLCVLIHGFTQNHRTLTGLSQALVDRNYCVVSLDRYGDGESSCPDGPYDLNMFTSQISELLVDLGLHPDRTFMLGGSSLGGIIATAFANRYPHRVRSLILINPGGIPYSPWRLLNPLVSSARLLFLLGRSPLLGEATVWLCKAVIKQFLLRVLSLAMSQAEVTKLLNAPTPPEALDGPTLLRQQPSRSHQPPTDKPTSAITSTANINVAPPSVATSLVPAIQKGGVEDGSRTAAASPAGQGDAAAGGGLLWGDAPTAAASGNAPTHKACAVSVQAVAPAAASAPRPKERLPATLTPQAPQQQQLPEGRRRVRHWIVAGVALWLLWKRRQGAGRSLAAIAAALTGQRSAGVLAPSKRTTAAVSIAAVCATTFVAARVGAVIGAGLGPMTLASEGGAGYASALRATMWSTLRTQFGVTPWMVVAWVRAFSKPGYTRAVVRTLRQVNMLGDLRPMYREVGLHHRPVLMVWGSRDCITPLSCMDTLQQCIPSADRCVIQGGGHGPFHKDPVGVANAMVQLDDRCRSMQRSKKKQRPVPASQSSPNFLPSAASKPARV